MADIGIRVERLNYDRLEKRAEAFIEKHHPSREIPIPIEEIIDVRLRIDIVPIPGLTKVLSDDEDDGIEAFVNSTLTQITVDKDAFERQTNRYRFSIAHELAHIELHPSIFSKLRFDSIDQWRQVMKSVPEEQYRWLEWQAYSFAGLVLVPTRELTDTLENHIARVEAEGMETNNDAVRLFLEKQLGDIFSVSSAVIHKRIDKEKLWSL